jgi:hypothetical protein
MELNGEDKRMRELFCELKREEDRTSPLFATTWNNAEGEFHRTRFSRLRFRSSANLLRFATAILVVSLVVTATVLLPKYLRQHRQPKPDYAKQEAAAGSRITSKEPARSEKVPANKESGNQLIGCLRSANPSALRIHRSHLASQCARSNKIGFPSGSRQPRHCCARPAMNC